MVMDVNADNPIRIILLGHGMVLCPYRGISAYASTSIVVMISESAFSGDNSRVPVSGE